MTLEFALFVLMTTALAASLAVIVVLWKRLQQVQGALRSLQTSASVSGISHPQPPTSYLFPPLASSSLLPPDALRPRDKAFLARLSDVILEEMAHGKVGVETLADRMCVSHSQLNRRVKALTGMSTSNYSLAVRIAEASRRLREEPDTPVGDIARQCGFDDAAYFARAFKRHTGQSPTLFRAESASLHGNNRTE